MKKMLALVLVLATASLANAAVSFELDGPILTTPGSTVRLNVINTGSLLSLDAKVSLDLGAGTGSVVAIMSNADSASYGWDPAGYPDNGVMTATTGEFGGTQFNFNSQSIVGYIDILYMGGTIIANLANATGLNCGDTLDDSFNSLSFSDAVTITSIPEPITMSLLAVGGLFLRRRK